MDDDAQDPGFAALDETTRSFEPPPLGVVPELGSLLPQVSFPEANGEAFALPAVSPKAKAKKSRRWVPFALLAAMLVGAATAGVVATNHGSGVPGTGMSPVDFVVSSTQNTLAQHTADMVISGNVQVDGHTIPMQGTGQIDFTTHDVTGTIHAAAQGVSMVEQVLLYNHQMFYGMSVNGMDVSNFTGGAHWIQVPLPSASSASGSLGGVGNIDPLSQMKLLTQQGASVVPLGTSVINGVTVSGFAVTPSKAEVDRMIQSEVASGQISQSLADQIEQSETAIGTFTSDVYFDGSGLMRRVTVNVGGGTAGATATVVETLSNFGAPVSIQGPAPSDVISFQQFMNDVQSLQST